MTLSRSSGETLAAGGKIKSKKKLRNNKIRKNAVSIFLEVKVRDLVAVQRRDAGRRRQNKINKKT